MKRIGSPLARGGWQIPAFVASLVLGAVVWVLFPEPEESRQGYTASGCYERARQHFAAAVISNDVYRRSELFAAAIKYLDALERRFGIARHRWYAYEMLGDANAELAAVSQVERDITEQLRLRTAGEIRAEALRAYRAARDRVEGGDDAVARLRRKEAEILLALRRPDEALEILGDLIRVYRTGDIERLRAERDTGVSVAPGGTLAGESADEVRAVYFLAGTAAEETKRNALSLAREALAAGRPELKDNHEAAAARYSDEIDRTFSLFLKAGGAGKRRAIAETALGNLKFERARSGAEPRVLLEEARNHYASAETPEAAFLLARTLFALGEYASALQQFGTGRLVELPERRARRYMAARCMLAMGDAKGASDAFLKLRADDDGDADAAAALVHLAEIAVAAGELARASDLLSAAVSARSLAGTGMELPERDAQLAGAALAERLVALAESFEALNDADRAIALYRTAARIEPAGPARTLRRIAAVLERQAEALSSVAPLVAAGETYRALADVLGRSRQGREAMRIAAESFARGGAYGRAIVTARTFLDENPDDEYASRMAYLVGTWEAKLGLADAAAGHLESNSRTRSGDVYADRSVIELAKLASFDGGLDGLNEARRMLRAVVANAGRYDDESLVRLEALLLLGRVDVRLAERASVSAAGSSTARREVLEEAVGALDAALAKGPDEHPASGPGARPLFAELIRSQRPQAFLYRGIAQYLLGRHAKALEDLRRAGESGAGTTAALYEALAACSGAGLGAGDAEAASFTGMLGQTDDAAWAFTCAALLDLKADRPAAAMVSALSATGAAAPERAAGGLLAPKYWQRWSSWVASHAEEGIPHARGN